DPVRGHGHRPQRDLQLLPDPQRLGHPGLPGLVEQHHERTPGRDLHTVLSPADHPAAFPAGRAARRPSASAIPTPGRRGCSSSIGMTLASVARPAIARSIIGRVTGTAGNHVPPTSYPSDPVTNAA